MEVGCRAAVQERDERTVLVGKKPHRLDLSASDVAKDLFRRSLWWDVTKVDGSARSGDKPGRDTHGLVAAERAVREGIEASGRRLHASKVGDCVHSRRGSKALVRVRGEAALLLLLERVVHLSLLVLARVLLGEVGKILELRRLICRWGSGLERATHQQPRGEKRSVVHVVASLGGLHVGTVVC